MLFDWKEYLSIAEFLAKQDESEFSHDAAFRCAVSRAYYAAFCYARNYARDKHDYVPKDDYQDHSFLRNHFRKSNRGDIARWLGHLRGWRNECDYRDVVGDLQRILHDALDHTNRILKSLN